MLTRRTLYLPSIIPGSDVEGRIAALERAYRSLTDALVADRVALNTPGAVDIADAIINATNGVQFPATQNASTDANTLDDYEEGTWTPADGSGAGLTLTATQTARYTKIGNRVFGSCYVTYPATASGATAFISGLPFTTAGIVACPMECNAAGAYTLAQVTGSSLQPITSTAGAVTNANLTGAVVIISFNYSV